MVTAAFNSLISLIGRYVRPIETYGYSFLGLIAGSGAGATSLSASTSALVAAFPAVTHLAVEVVKDIKDLYATLEADYEQINADVAPAVAEVTDKLNAAASAPAAPVPPAHAN